MIAGITWRHRRIVSSGSGQFSLPILSSLIAVPLVVKEDVDAVASCQSSLSSPCALLGLDSFYPCPSLRPYIALDELP